MKILKKIISLIIVIFIFFSLTCNTTTTFASSNLNVGNRKITNIAVLLYSFNDIFLSKVKESFEDIQKNNNDIRFTFYDGKNNISIQNETFDSLLNDDIDLFIVNLVNVKEDIAKDYISKAKQKNVPLVLIEIPPQIVSKLYKEYDKAAFVTTESKIAGTIEGKILVDLWNANKKVLDKNGDNTLQYILLQGETNNPIAIDRTNAAISALNDSGIKTQQLALVSANWLKDLAKISIDNLFLKYGGRIEAIISNNDAMAIGAIESLQKYGYNKGDKSKYIAVVGIDALPEARDLVDKGFMTGTVNQDPKALAEGLFNVGMNLVNGMNPIENTNYKFSNGEIIIPVGFEEYTIKETTTP